MLSRRRSHRWRAGSLLAAGLALLAASCGGDGGGAGAPEAPDVLRGWERQDVVHRVAAHAYDRVATASAPGRLAWLARAGGTTDLLAYYETIAADGFASVDLAPPAAPAGATTTPVAVATTADGWVAAAEAGAEPAGLADRLVAWRGGPRAGPAPAGEVLAVEAGTTIVPDTVSVARLGDTGVLLALTGPAPPPDDGPTAPPAPEDVVAWTATGDGGWQRLQPELGLDSPLTSARVVGDTQRLVLAGVVGGEARLWSSRDARAWTPIEADRLPRDVERVELLTTVGPGEVALGWRPAGGDGPVVQLLDPDGLTDAGAVEPDPDTDIGEIVLDGATRDDRDQLLLVGTAFRPAATPVPLVWAHHGEGWAASRQAELLGRLDYSFRAVTTAGDGTLRGLITRRPAADTGVELWRRRSSDA